MADIMIFVGSIAPSANGDDITIYGEARCSGMSDADSPVAFSCEVDPGALAATVNSAIKDAAVAAADVRGYTVGVGDKKNLLAGAIGL